MLTTAGVTFFSIGARLGTGVSPTAPGSWASATGTGVDWTASSRRAARLE